MWFFICQGCQRQVDKEVVSSITDALVKRPWTFHHAKSAGPKLMNVRDCLHRREPLRALDYCDGQTPMVAHHAILAMVEDQGFPYSVVQRVQGAFLTTERAQLQQIIHRDPAVGYAIASFQRGFEEHAASPWAFR